MARERLPDFQSIEQLFTDIFFKILNTERWYDHNMNFGMIILYERWYFYDHNKNIIMIDGIIVVMKK
jgi:hypothetical protein